MDISGVIRVRLQPHAVVETAQFLVFVCVLVATVMVADMARRHWHLHILLRAWAGPTTIGRPGIASHPTLIQIPGIEMSQAPEHDVLGSWEIIVFGHPSYDL